MDATFERRERDRLIRELGEAALALLETGALPAHPGLMDCWNAIRCVDERLDKSAGRSRISRAEATPARWNESRRALDDQT